MKERDKAWMRGFAAALSSIWTMHHDGDMVRHVLKGNGFDLADLKAAGVEDPDFKWIVEAVRS